MTRSFVETFLDGDPFPALAAAFPPAPPDDALVDPAVPDATDAAGVPEEAEPDPELPLPPFSISAESRFFFLFP